MGFGSKARKFGNRFLKTTATAGTIARKTGHLMEESGKVVGGLGIVMKNPEMIEAGAGMVATGDMAQEAGIIARKGAVSLRTGDASKMKTAGKKMINVLK
tara:strand:- start:1342 stop:1641 length:300 start_codon:yes stop_codon:yes gene_type:complete